MEAPTGCDFHKLSDHPFGELRNRADMVSFRLRKCHILFCVVKDCLSGHRPDSPGFIATNRKRHSRNAIEKLTAMKVDKLKLKIGLKLVQALVI